MTHEQTTLDDVDQPTLASWRGYKLLARTLTRGLRAELLSSDELEPSDG